MSFLKPKQFEAKVYMISHSLNLIIYPYKFDFIWCLDYLYFFKFEAYSPFYLQL